MAPGPKPIQTPHNLIRCPRCQRNLDPICFYKDRSKSSGRKSHCRNCTKTACRNWKQENPEKVAEYKAEERRERRELRLRNRELRELYGAQSEAADYQQMVDLFGPDCESQGIHLSNKRSTKLIRPKLNDVEEFGEIYDLLSENQDFDLGSEYEFVSNLILFRLFSSLFHWEYP